MLTSLSLGHTERARKGVGSQPRQNTGGFDCKAGDTKHNRLGIFFDLSSLATLIGKAVASQDAEIIEIIPHFWAALSKSAALQAMLASMV